MEVDTRDDARTIGPCAERSHNSIDGSTAGKPIAGTLFSRHGREWHPIGTDAYNRPPHDLTPENHGSKTLPTLLRALSGEYILASEGRRQGSRTGIGPMGLCTTRVAGHAPVHRLTCDEGSVLQCG